MSMCGLSSFPFLSSISNFNDGAAVIRLSPSKKQSSNLKIKTKTKTKTK